jgi:hypothetical protein
MESLELRAASKDGREVAIAMEVDDSADASIRITSPESFAGLYLGIDLFACLGAVRSRLEEDGLLLCCQGASLSVYPSGMTRQMSNGRLAYPMRRSPPVTDADLIDIFAPAGLAEVGTIAEQLESRRAFFASLGVKLRPR